MASIFSGLFSGKNKKAASLPSSDIISHRLIKRVLTEVMKQPGSVQTVTIRSNRVDWQRKEEFEYVGNGSVFFDDPTLSRLEQGEMKQVAEYLLEQLGEHGYMLEEDGKGEKGTFRYHIESYIIRAKA